MPTVADLISNLETQRTDKLVARNDCADQLSQFRQMSAADLAPLTQHVENVRKQRADLDVELDVLEDRIKELRAEKARDDAVARVQAEVHGTEEPGQEQRAGGREVRTGAGKFTVRDRPGPAGVERGQRFIDHPTIARLRADNRAGEDAAMALHGGIAQYVRSLTTTGASAVVPVAWAADIIDIARNSAAVLQAGATVVPMDTLSLTVGRLTGDPVSSFRAEGSAITATDPTFDNILLTAKSINCMVIASNEWYADAGNADQLVMSAIGKSMGLAIDKAALYGGIISGAGTVNLPTPPNPRGVLAALNLLRPGNVLGGSATNGTTPTNYNELIDLDFLLENLNEEPNGLIWPSRLAQKYAKFYDTMGQPLRKPDAVTDFPFYTSNQVAAGMTQGTATTAADVFLADWTELLVGMRADIELKVLSERYADVGQTAILASARLDFALARPSAFAVYRYLVGS